jgi:hypothetical protein
MPIDTAIFNLCVCCLPTMGTLRRKKTQPGWVFYKVTLRDRLSAEARAAAACRRRIWIFDDELCTL